MSRMAMQERDRDMERVERMEGTEVLLMSPDDLIYPEYTAIRNIGTTDEEGLADLKNLANSILNEGQLQPVVAVERMNDEGVEYHLIAGRRRAEAVRMLREDGSDILLRVMVSRDIDEDVALRRAVMENVHRKQMSPMELANAVVGMRDSLGWKDDKGWPGKVAELLSMSPSTVRQHAKLLTLPGDVQDKIGAGQLSADAGFELAGIKPEKREEVLTEAVAIEEKEEEKAAAAGKKGKTKRSGEVAAQSIVQAARAVDGATTTISARSRKEIIGAFEQFDSTEYGWKNSPTRKFVTFFVEKYVTGQGSDKQFVKLFEGMMLGDQGTPSKAEQAEMEQEEDVTPVEVESTPAAPVKKRKKEAA